jgi:hypothetical protein
VTSTTREIRRNLKRGSRKLRRGSWAVNDRPLLARAERHADRAAMIRAATLIVEQTGVTLEELIKRRKRGRPPRLPAEARKLGLYLAAVVLDVPIGRLARSARVGHQDVSRWLHQVEDRREDPAYDAFVARLETALSRHWGGTVQEGCEA